MNNKHTVTIGGRLYDAHTGLAVDTAEKVKSPEAYHIHATTQRSQTLDRAHTKKPVTAARPVVYTRQRAIVPKSPAISRFAAHPQVTTKAPVMDIRPARPHPIVTKVEAIHQAEHAHKQAVAAPKPSDVIKQEAISKSLETAPAHAAGSHQTKKHARKRSRVLSIVSASFALILLAGYMTYLNMPVLSVRVAAAQAGIDATYPQYHPDSYALNGAVTYKNGEVAMKFTSKAGPQNFSLTQEKSSWDSSAVQQFVTNKTHGQYLTDVENGMTIYTYGGNAAWVNGGILYTINGNAPLSSDQIRHIATSM